MAKPQGEKLIAENRRARHEYHLLERVEAGLALAGSEVKSLRQGQATLQRAYADPRDGELWLVGLLVAVVLRPPDLRRLQRPRDAAAAPGSLEPGHVVVRRLGLGSSERELRVTHHLVAGEREEGRLRLVARALHVID